MKMLPNFGRFFLSILAKFLAQLTVNFRSNLRRIFVLDSGWISCCIQPVSWSIIPQWNCAEYRHRRTYNEWTNVLGSIKSKKNGANNDPLYSAFAIFSINWFDGCRSGWNWPVRSSGIGRSGCRRCRLPTRHRWKTCSWRSSRSRRNRRGGTKRTSSRSGRRPSSCRSFASRRPGTMRPVCSSMTPSASAASATSSSTRR